MTAGVVAVSGSNFDQGSRVRINGQYLGTEWRDNLKLHAEVPADFITEAGLYPVSVEAPGGRLSNSMQIRLVPASPVPIIRKLYPETAVAGKPFQVQPDGSSAIGIVGGNFFPGAVAEMNGEQARTVVENITTMSALVPSKFLSAPGRVQIVVRGKNGKASQPVALVVAAQ